MKSKKTVGLICILLFLSARAFCTQVTGNLKTILEENLTGITVKFRLRNFEPNVPKVVGTGVIVRAEENAKPNATGLISVTVYGNDQIAPAGTYYTVEYYIGGKYQFSADYLITGATFDLNSAAPITTVPVVLPPTGDDTYLRTDAGNSNLMTTTEIPTLNAGRVGGTEVTNSASLGLVPVGTGAGTAAWGTPDGARVYNSAGEAIPTVTDAALTFDSERYDNGGLHSTVSLTSRLTAAKAGKYLITGNVQWASSTGFYLVAYIRLNATTRIAWTRYTPSISEAAVQNLSTVYHLAASDYVELVVLQGTVGNLDVEAVANYSPEFAMQWVGP